VGAQSKRFGFRRAEFALSTPCIARPPLAEETKKVLAIVDKSNDPEKIAVAERVLESYQNYMRQIGLFKSEEISTANEGKLHARWKLGQLLAKVIRGNHGPNAGRVLTGLTHLLERLHMTPPIAMEAQRIGTLPAATEFENALRCNAMGGIVVLSDGSEAEASIVSASARRAS